MIRCALLYLLPGIFCGISLSAQELRISAPIPVRVEIDGHRSGSISNNWNLTWTGSDTALIKLYNNADSLLIERKVIGRNQSAIYVLDSLNGRYKLYFRRGIALPTAPRLDYTAWERAEPIPETDSIFLLAQTPETDTPSTNTFTILDSLARLPYEFDKMQTAIAWAERNQPEIDEVRNLCLAMKYANAKLSLLKSVYPYCREKQRYALLIDVFEFEETQSAFLLWLNEHR